MEKTRSSLLPLWLGLASCPVWLLLWFLPVFPLAAALLLFPLIYAGRGLGLWALALLSGLILALSALGSAMAGLWPIGIAFSGFTLLSAWVSVLLLRRKPGFFAALRMDVALNIVLLALLYALLTLQLGDLSTLLVNWFKEGFTLLPADMQSAILSLQASAALPEGEAGLAELQKTLFFNMESSLREGMLASFVSWALYAGALAPAAALYALKAEKLAAGEVPSLEDLRLPRKLGRFLMPAILAIFLLQLFIGQAFAPILLAAWEGLSFLLAAQGMSLAEWFLKRRRWPAALRF
ncbi:MAG: hypothetical protein LBU47_07335 [Christensenellaceae bacterium]|jgi:hypothetical protein|nr:hypothetical protein [Christensenellaceae bacterium]